jgi:hypothetical protein
VQVHKTLTAAPSIRSRLSRIYHAQPAGVWVVFGVACSFEAAWFAVLNVGFFYMVVAALTRRSLGYPLLLLVAGAPVVNSFIGILLLLAAIDCDAGLDLQDAAAA